MSGMQSEFLFDEGASPQVQPDDPNSAFYEEVTGLWQLPIGQAVHVALRSHHFAELQGRLLLAHAPDLPLDVRQPLSLRIAAIEFSSRQVIAWALV
jgi:hypothetical protein